MISVPPYCLVLCLVQRTAVLLDNEKIPGLEGFHSEDIYFSTNLALMPDISTVGREYYTLVYQIELPNSTHLNPRSMFRKQPNETRKTLRISGVNYRAHAYLNGMLIRELSSHSYDGMFRRRSFDVTTGGLFQIVIEPPLHPGSFSPDDSSSDEIKMFPYSNLRQQGGNHELAKDGPTAQFMLGWDWCQAMPDRATGFYGSVLLEESGPAALVDPAIQTLSVTCHTVEYDPVHQVRGSNCSHVGLSALVHIECPACGNNNQTGRLRIVSDWEETWESTLKLSDAMDLRRVLPVHHPEKVQLWWPHGIGINPAMVAHMHTFTFFMEIFGNDDTLVLSDATSIRVGVRQVDTWLDTELQGQTFAVNGHRFYVVGGNWISPDQALRYSASRRRYCHELALHVHAGFNLIRVWGGAMAETEDFYHCANELGLLVFQEFWMTGDNNGRWAGNATWPLDHETYLANVRDTVRRLRNHPSLLLYGGCNECFGRQWTDSPPGNIDHGIREILHELDPGRFYIPSSSKFVRFCWENRGTGFLTAHFSCFDSGRDEPIL